MDLFSHNETLLPGTPLAEALRPRKLDDFVGQSKLLGPNGPIRLFLKKGYFPSSIFWGPPGTGKTTLAKLLAREFDAELLDENAIDLGAKALRELGEECRNRRQLYQKRTFLFVDEIHRLNKAQQDVLLPFVEKGDFILIGATTENPAYELTSALLSRCRLFVFEPLDDNALAQLMKKAFAHRERNQAKLLTSDAAETALKFADGDARKLFNLIEQLAELSSAANDYTWPLDNTAIKKIIDVVLPHYDKNADNHYDIISAFIKSVRGSDPDAAIYYLARMLKGGEDPRFIARRLVILASEDIGNADPRALMLAVSGFQAVEMIGLPEAAINLAHVTTYLACSPKSNRSYLALRAAQAQVNETGSLPVPKALRSGDRKALRDLGYGAGYQYAHDGDKGWTDQKFLPEALGAISFYEPSERGYEKHIREFLKWLKN